MARILIIEDNPANMKLACLLMRNAGHSVLCAVDAENGLTLARAEQPDLILMDIQLPGMDGFAATALLKQDPVSAAIPVIALTSMAMKEDQEKSRAAGCDAYIAKPLRYQDLYAAIETLLNREKLPAADSRLLDDAHTPPGDRHEAEFKPPSHDEALRSGRLILVAEDNQTSQKLILRQLALLGFAAEAVGNGSLALERWRSGDYALLLSDLHMPGMDGYQLTAAIRAEEQAARRIPIVALTASFVTGDDDRGRVADVDAYMSKPLLLASLKAILETWLPAAAPMVDQHHHGVPRAAAAQAVDVGVLASLVGNDPAVIDEFLRDFRITSANIAADLIAACSERQAIQAGAHAHKLMASSRSVGALALGDLCARMETAGNAGNTAAMAALLPDFEKEFDAVNAFLDRLLA